MLSPTSYLLVLVCLTQSCLKWWRTPDGTLYHPVTLECVHIIWLTHMAGSLTDFVTYLLSLGSGLPDSILSGLMENARRHTLPSCNTKPIINSVTDKKKVCAEITLTTEIKCKELSTWAFCITKQNKILKMISIFEKCTIWHIHQNNICISSFQLLIYFLEKLNICYSGNHTFIWSIYPIILHFIYTLGYKTILPQGGMLHDWVPQQLISQQGSLMLTHR